MSLVLGTLAGPPVQAAPSSSAEARAIARRSAAEIRSARARLVRIRARVSEARRRVSDGEAKTAERERTFFSLDGLKSDVDDLEREKRQVLFELANGQFCSRCERSASQIIEQEGTSFEEHLDDVDGVRIPAPQELIEKTVAQYDAKIAKAEQRLQEAKNRIAALDLEMSALDLYHLRVERDSAIAEEEAVTRELNAALRRYREAQRDAIRLAAVERERERARALRERDRRLRERRRARRRASWRSTRNARDRDADSQPTWSDFDPTRSSQENLDALREDEQEQLSEMLSALEEMASDEEGESEALEEMLSSMREEATGDEPLAPTEVIDDQLDLHAVAEAVEEEPRPTVPVEELERRKSMLAAMPGAEGELLREASRAPVPTPVTDEDRLQTELSDLSTSLDLADERPSTTSNTPIARAQRRLGTVAESLRTDTRLWREGANGDIDGSLDELLNDVGPEQPPALTAGLGALASRIEVPTSLREVAEDLPSVGSWIKRPPALSVVRTVFRGVQRRVLEELRPDSSFERPSGRSDELHHSVADMERSISIERLVFDTSTRPGPFAVLGVRRFAERMTRRLGGLLDLGWPELFEEDDR